jgi:hypothetical protein
MLVHMAIAWMTLGQTPPVTFTTDVAQAAETKPATAVAKAGRSLTEIRRDVSSALREHRVAEHDHQRAAAAHRLVALHREITSDARFATNPFLQDQRGKVWTRLLEVRSELQRRRAREARTPPADPASDPKFDEVALAAQLEFSSQMAGGPLLLLSRGGGAVSDDYGDELVALIQHTINPATWNVNGGPGSIVYYRPWMALVVRASSSVHHDVGALLDDMR